MSLEVIGILEAFCLVEIVNFAGLLMPFYLLQSSHVVSHSVLEGRISLAILNQKIKNRSQTFWLLSAAVRCSRSCRMVVRIRRVAIICE